jgi:DNA invertase Pin-like site-specific DNA recombinase
LENAIPILQSQEMNMKKVGYLRVSKTEQSHDRQVDGLHGICDETHVETLSAVSAKRPIFENIISNLSAGDTLVVWDLDRAFRSTIDAITTAEELKTRGIEFQIVSLSIDTATPHGEFAYTVMAAAAQFERRLLGKRTKEGLEAARKRGARLGRPPKLSKAQIGMANLRLDDLNGDMDKLAIEYSVSIWTMKRALDKATVVEVLSIETTLNS